MASNQLTATVKINTTQAEKALERLNKKINSINKAVNSANRGGANKPVQKVNQINRLLTQVRQKINSIMSSSSRLGSAWNRASNIAGKIGTKLTQWKSHLSSAVASARHFNSALNSAKGITSSIWHNLKNMAATYLGIMGTRTAIETSDTITSAQNRLNYLNGQEYGINSPKALNMTQETMDKMYHSAQKVRMSYTDMMANVSKTMTLAGDAFQGNIDNAIRFQEIMAESYTLGGASAAEMSSSMYQLTQALGAGVLAGDELRSVREGAPLAYQAIEEFAQGVYNTTDSLKDMASEGKISSDMVVAAIMNMGDEADKAFAQTHILFSQAWTMITNAAKKAFEPVSNMLRDMLNKAMDSGVIQKFEVAFTNIAKVLMITLQVISNVFSWIADNWSWLEGVLISGLTTIGILMVATAIKSAIAWIVANWSLILIAAMIFAIIYLLYQWQKGALDTCTLIIGVLGVIAVALFIFFGWQVALIVALLALVFMFFEQICGGAMWLVTALYNIASYITSFVFACLYAILAIAQNILAGIVNVTVACGNSIMAIASNIGIAFQNAWIWAKNSFWEFIADVLDGMSKLEPVINGIAKLIGKDGVDFGGLASSMRSRKGEYKAYNSVSAAWSSGMGTMAYQDVSDAWSSGWNVSQRKDLSDAYATGAAWGANLKDGINAWGSGKANQLHNGLGNKLNVNNIGKSLGLDLTGVNAPNGGGGGTGTGGSYDPNKFLDGINNGVGKIGDDTGAIKDSMDLTEEDLKFLRDVANMEWKKEFTTATIQVDMSNYNTVNGDGDLDGIVTRLADKLYEELDMVANGVYAY